MKPVLVSGLATVTTRKARSKLAATMWLCLDRLTERRTIALRRFSRSTISGGSSSPWNSMTTPSPTAKGLVERSPCRRKRPPARQEYTPPVSASRTSYHEPVERKTTPRVCRISIKPLCRGIETPPPGRPVDWTCWPPNHRRPTGRGGS